MEDTQDIRGNNYYLNPLVPERVSTNNQPSCNAIHESEDLEDLSKMVKL